MKANELRIGSTYKSVKFNTPVVLTAEDIFELVNKADGANIEHYIKDMFEPIPLTEDELLKMRFSSDDYKDGYIGIDVNHTSFVLTKPGGEYNYKYFVWEFKNDRWPKYIELPYVHQLQNFYFEVTGEELTQSNQKG